MPEVASIPVFSTSATATTAAGLSAASSQLGAATAISRQESSQGNFANILKQQLKPPQQQTASSTPAAASDAAAGQTLDPASIAALVGNFLPQWLLPQVAAIAAQDESKPELAADALAASSASLPSALPDGAAAGKTTTRQSDALPQAKEDTADSSSPAVPASPEALLSQLMAPVTPPAPGGNSPRGETSEEDPRRPAINLATAAPNSASTTATRSQQPDDSAGDAAALLSPRSDNNTAGSQDKTPAAEFAGRLMNTENTANAATAALAADEPAMTQRTGTANGSPTSFDQLLAGAQAQLNPAHPLHGTRLHAETPAQINAPLGSSAWRQEFGDQLVWMVGRQEQRAELVLNPPQLGRVEISLTIHGEQTNASFVAANPAVRDALESALPRLREMFADAGLNLGQAQVGADSGSHAANQSFANSGNGDNSSRYSSASDERSEGNMVRLMDEGPWLRQGSGMVDTFA